MRINQDNISLCVNAHGDTLMEIVCTQVQYSEPFVVVL